MFLEKRTTASTNSCLEKIKTLKEKIDTADAILIGAGAGLSAAAGLEYSGKRFTDNFSDFIEKLLTTNVDHCFQTAHTRNKLTKKLRKRCISGHLQIQTTIYKERRCA